MFTGEEQNKNTPVLTSPGEEGGEEIKEEVEGKGAQDESLEEPKEDEEEVKDEEMDEKEDEEEEDAKEEEETEDSVIQLFGQTCSCGCSVFFTLPLTHFLNNPLFSVSLICRSLPPPHSSPNLLPVTQ